MKSNMHSILLGGLSGDAHSVGLYLLRQALSDRGYQVYFIGNQNSPEDFQKYAKDINVVMISSVDGHSLQYLKNFQLNEEKDDSTLWYIGGNLTIAEDTTEVSSTLMEKGFDRVFPKFTSISGVVKTLEQDLHLVTPKTISNPNSVFTNQTNINNDRLLITGKIDFSHLSEVRQQVLSTWETGHQASSINDNAEFLSQSPSFFKSLHQAELPDNTILVQPRCGTSCYKKQLKLFSAYRDAGANVLSYQVDSLTRNNRYIEVADAIKLNNLNGFPIVNHGVSTLREISTSVDIPLQTRHSTRDPRLLAEISYAGGVTAFEGGAICYNIPYFKDYPLQDSIESWKYVDALTGHYFEAHNVVIDREFFGTLTATLIPPSIAIAINLLEMLLAVEQGVKCVSLGYAEQGCRYQDVAAIRVLKKLATQILKKFEYTGVSVFTVFHQYMAAFPNDIARSEQLIEHSIVTAILSGATKVLTKTPVESLKIPLLKDNLRGLELVNNSIEQQHQISPDLEMRIIREEYFIKMEVEAILESVFEAGNGTIEYGIIKGFEVGLLDIPFSPSIHCLAKMKPLRDDTGAIRYADIGNLHLPRQIVQYHEDCLRKRILDASAGIATPYENLLEFDLTQIPLGYYDEWPLDARLLF